MLPGLRNGPLAVPAFRLLITGQLTSSIGDLCYAVALPWLVLSGDGGPVLLGAVLAVYGISRAVAIPVGGMVGLGAGLVIGSVLAHRGWLGERPILPLVGLGLLMALAIGLLPFTGGLPGAVVCITVFSIANSWSGVVVITMLQVWTPRGLLGRTMSLLLLAMSGTFPLAVAVTGVMVDRVGVRTFFVIAGVAMGAAVLAALAQPVLRRYRSGDRFAMTAWSGGGGG